MVLSFSQQVQKQSLYTSITSDEKISRISFWTGTWHPIGLRTGMRILYGTWLFMASLHYNIKNGSAANLMVIIIRNGHDDQSSNPRPGWLHNANPPVKVWIQLFSLQLKVEYLGRLGSLILVWGEGKQWIQTNCTLLKKWPCDTFSSLQRGWVNTYIIIESLRCLHIWNFTKYQLRFSKLADLKALFSMAATSNCR